MDNRYIIKAPGGDFDVRDAKKSLDGIWRRYAYEHHSVSQSGEEYEAWCDQYGEPIVDALITILSDQKDDIGSIKP